ncbi:MAG: putative sporulation protein YtxC [Clostridia bacterium]
MKSLCIKTNNIKLLEYLLNELKYSNLKEVCFSTNKFKHYHNIIIHYLGNNPNEFYSKLSNILSFLVIDELEDSILEKIILQNYFYFNYDERKEILNYYYSILSDDYYEKFESKFSSLYNIFLEYISENKSLVLNGFLNFRIQGYYKILNEIISESVNLYLMEKEYKEFISLLRFYINSQSSNSNIVHLICNSNENVLIDENKNIINIYDEVFNAKYLSDITFSSNDYILNTLLNLLPKKIYIHLLDNSINEFITTLQLVFENRVELCVDCDICKLYKNKNMEKGLSYNI